MKQILATVLSIILIVSQFIVVNAENTDKVPRVSVNNDEVTITGTVRSHKCGEQLTAIVLYPSKSLEDLDGNIADSVLYTNTTLTDIGGKYRFSFKLGETEGMYKIYIRDINNLNLSELYVCKNNSIKVEVSLGEVTVTGNIRSHKAGEPVTIVVLYPDKTLDDLKDDSDDVLFYTNTVTTDIGGGYKFDFKLGKQKGNYNIYIRDVNKTELNQLFVTRDSLIEAEVDIDDIGHICFDYAAIPIRCKLFANPNSDIEIVTDIYDTENNKKIGTVNSRHRTDKNGFLDEYLNLNLSKFSKRYGFFKAQCRITDQSNGENVTKEVKFSSANSPISGILNKKMGLNHHWDYYDDINYNENVIDLFMKAGYSDFRTSVGWGTFEENAYKLDKNSEEYINSVIMKDGRVLITLSGTNKLHYDRDEENKVISTTPSTEESFSAFGEYCYQLALAVKGYTHEYEVLNEFNMDGGYSNPHGYGPDNYVELMKRAYENIHNADPEAIVYGIDAAYVTENDQYIYTTYQWIDEVMRIMKEQDACYMDALSFHIYTGAAIPEKGNKQQIVKNVRDILSKYGYGDMKIFLTESGYSSDRWSERQQAKFELRDWAMLYNSVDKLYWYNAVEKNHKSQYEHNLGHIRMNEATDMYEVDLPSEAKPVFLAMSNWNALLANSELIESNVSSDNTIYDYVFKTTNDKRVHMVWGTGETSILNEFDIGASSLVKYDMYGNSQNLTSENGKYTISVSDEPVYLAEPTDIDIEFMSGDMPTNKIGSSEEISVNVNINESVFDTNSSATVIVSAYKDYVLKSVSIENVSKQNLSVSKTIKADGADKISVLIWEDLRPITNIESIYK